MNVWFICFGSESIGSQFYCPQCFSNDFMHLNDSWHSVILHCSRCFRPLTRGMKRSFISHIQKRYNKQNLILKFMNHLFSALRCFLVFLWVHPVRGGVPCAGAFRWTSGLIVCDLRLSGCSLSQITFWHSSLLSQTLRYLGPRVDGGPNDKASLTISRQEQGGERGKLNCQREKRREEERRRGRGGWGGGGVTPSCKMEPVIICSFGAHQALPSLSNTAPLTFLPLFHPPLSSISLPPFHLLAYLHSSQRDSAHCTCDMIVLSLQPALALPVISNIILIKCINWWFKGKITGGFKSW